MAPATAAQERLTETFRPWVLARLRTMPGVLSAASASDPPMQGGTNLPVTADNNPDKSYGTVSWRAVSPQYFKTLGVTLIRGRDFAETDRMGSPGVVIISKSLADKFWPGEDPVGHRMALGQWRGKPFFADEPERTVIGVAADTRQLGLTFEAPPLVFVPQGQVPAVLVKMPEIMVRTAGASASALIGQAVAEADPRMPPQRYQTIDQLVTNSVASDRFIATLMGLFAALALIVTCVGIYGVASYAVASRTRDIGVRMALGAPAHRVLTLVIRQGMLPVVVGSAAGLAAALALTRLMANLLYGVSVRDPATLAIVTAVLTTSALLGTWLPARRAARIDPLITLRGE